MSDKTYCAYRECKTDITGRKTRDGKKMKYCCRECFKMEMNAQSWKRRTGK